MLYLSADHAKYLTWKLLLILCWQSNVVVFFRPFYSDFFLTSRFFWFLLLFWLEKNTDGKFLQSLDLRCSQSYGLYSSYKPSRDFFPYSNFAWHEAWRWLTNWYYAQIRGTLLIVTPKEHVPCVYGVRVPRASLRSYPPPSLFFQTGKNKNFVLLQEKDMEIKPFSHRFPFVSLSNERMLSFYEDFYFFSFDKACFFYIDL